MGPAIWNGLTIRVARPASTARLEDPQRLVAMAFPVHRQRKRDPGLDESQQIGECGRVRLSVHGPGEQHCVVPAPAGEQSPRPACADRSGFADTSAGCKRGWQCEPPAREQLDVGE